MHKRGLQEKSEPGAPQKMTCTAACLLSPIFLPFAFTSLPQMGLPATGQKGADKSQQGQQEGGQPTPKGKGKSAEKLTRGEAKTHLSPGSRAPPEEMWKWEETRPVYQWRPGLKQVAKSCTAHGSRDQKKCFPCHKSQCVPY